MCWRFCSRIFSKSSNHINQWSPMKFWTFMFRELSALSQCNTFVTGAINFDHISGRTKPCQKCYYHQSESRSCWVDSLLWTAKSTTILSFWRSIRSNSFKPNGSLLRSPLVVEVMQACREGCWKFYEMDGACFLDLQLILLIYHISFNHHSL